MKARFSDRSPGETVDLIEGFATGFSRAFASLGFISTAFLNWLMAGVIAQEVGVAVSCRKKIAQCKIPKTPFGT
jgi:hypothetical protein